MAGICRDGIEAVISVKEVFEGAEVLATKTRIASHIRIGIVSPRFTHDLRRTMATSVAGIGFTGELIGKVLNHVDRSVTAIYNQHHYDREKQQALEAWERKLLAIVTGEKVGNVVEFRQG